MRASPTDILAKKSIRRTKVSELCQRAERAVRTVAGRLPPRGRPTSALAVYADFRKRILVRKSASKSVSVSVFVSVQWNLRFIALKKMILYHSNK